MQYIALLRGINAGKTRRVDMQRLRELFESLGHAKVATYINSGNVLFESRRGQAAIGQEIEAGLLARFGFAIPTLVKTRQQMQAIAAAIPGQWQNDAEQRSDVAYLFAEIDSAATLDQLPVKREFMDVRYTQGAIFWNIDRKYYNKSQLNKLVSHRLYQLMTIRNVNTARVLAGS